MVLIYSYWYLYYNNYIRLDMFYSYISDNNISVIRNPTIIRPVGIYYGLSARAGGVRASGDSGSFHLQMDDKLSEFYMSFNFLYLVYI